MTTQTQLLREAITLLRDVRPNRTGSGAKLARVYMGETEELDARKWGDERDALLGRVLDAMMSEAQGEVREVGE